MKKLLKLLRHRKWLDDESDKTDRRLEAAIRQYAKFRKGDKVDTSYFGATLRFVILESPKVLTDESLETLNFMYTLQLESNSQSSQVQLLQHYLQKVTE